MGLFDRFRKRVHEVAEETDGDALSVEASSEEGQALIEPPAEEPNIDVDDDWDDVEDCSTLSCVSECCKSKRDDFPKVSRRPLTQALSRS